ncbi:MAG: mechanosensitive ion channel family protein [Candidatus Nanohaloarchaea archaeon]|nr:mechanosensitive ion channel family protein [Candidatus Nanohaloarchaea archaeon]
MLPAFTSLPPVQQFLLGVAGSLVGAKAVQVVLGRLIRRAVSVTDSSIDDIIHDHIRRPLYLSVALVGIMLSAKVLVLDGLTRFVLESGTLSIVTVYWSLALIRTGRHIVRESQQHARFKSDLAPVFENLWTFVILLGGLFALLTYWNIDVTPLLASAGIAGIAVGFAAKDTVANFFGGLALYFDDTYKIGDYVMLDSGQAGTVTDVGIRSTTLKTRDDVLLTVPNSVLNSARIVNESAPEQHKRIDVSVGVAYGTDIGRLEEVLLDIASQEETVREEPEPRTRFRQFGDSALQYSLLCWVDEPLQDVVARDRLNQAIYKRLDEEGIEIPFPQRDVHMRDAESSDG